MCSRATEADRLIGGAGRVHTAGQDRS
jgi:hypothetical protein